MHKQISSTENTKICGGNNSTNDEKEQKGEIASIDCQPRRQTATQTLVIQSFSLLSSSARLAAVLLMFAGIVGSGGFIIGAEAAAHPLIGLANAPDTTSLRLCGLKLTMTLNTICKNQLCGGFMFEPPKKRMPPILLINSNIFLVFYGLSSFSFIIFSDLSPPNVYHLPSLS